ncbi:hypothetical protein CDL15_Pgr016407 [Punica granatum]|uniref:Uncharacterized protein n=1 Tax=Punica granatum TaxID=22663 RepID=A0A218XT46_PUNGR|nr:hypothetical protein CDL15_Pgr016407 [Punica granatum]PKI33225.1 hypothetical protein CRG98_046394 [Punica granatum]
MSSREGGGGDVTTSQRAEQRRCGHDREETGTEDGSAPSAEGVSRSVGEGDVRVYDGTVKLGSTERNPGGELRLGCCQRFPERMAVEGSSFLLPTYTYKSTLCMYMRHTTVLFCSFGDEPRSWFNDVVGTSLDWTDVV